VELPVGYALSWSGRWEAMERVRERLMVLVPVTLILIVMILLVATRSLAKTVMVLLVVPFSLVGAFWLLWALDYNLSVAVWVGLIALAGLDAETGVVMLLYLDLAWKKRAEEGRLASFDDLRAAVEEGAVERLRPKVMTVATTFLALLPILWATGIGADVMKRIAAPMIGGIVTSFVGELLVMPALYLTWRRWRHGREPVAMEGVDHV
ncbi:MAG: efflux RND transporter permease subunit, partial [Acidobacteriota bacterium]